MHFFGSFERQDKNEGRSIVYPTRPDKSFTVAQETNSFNYMGRLDHQMNTANNYSVRFLWDHQPNYNQVLTNGGGVGLGGTVDTLSIEKDNDYALVGTYNRVIGGKKLNILRLSAVHEKPKRGQPLYQEIGRLDAGAADAAVHQLHRSGGRQLRRLPRHERLRARRHLQLVHRRRRRQPRRQVRHAVPARRALPRRSARHQRTLHLRRPIARSTPRTRSPIRSG